MEPSLADKGNILDGLSAPQTTTIRITNHQNERIYLNDKKPVEVYAASTVEPSIGLLAC